MTTNELDFLRESNNIEDEWDDLSLQDAVLAWQYVKSKKRLSATVILETHQILMAHRSTLEADAIGHFRKCPVWIGGRQGKPWFAIPAMIDHWIVNVHDLLDNKTATDSPAFVEKIIRQHHIQYETIHPFVDGNGRTGRIFYNWQRVKMGLPLHVILEKTKHEDYYTWFR